MSATSVDFEGLYRLSEEAMDKIRASSKDSKKTYMMGAKTVGQIQVIVASMKQAQDAVETDTGVADLQELAEKLKANIAELVAIFEHAAQHRLEHKDTSKEYKDKLLFLTNRVVEVLGKSATDSDGTGEPKCDNKGLGEDLETRSTSPSHETCDAPAKLFGDNLVEGTKQPASVHPLGHEDAAVDLSSASVTADSKVEKHDDEPGKGDSTGKDVISGGGAAYGRARCR